MKINTQKFFCYKSYNYTCNRNKDRKQYCKSNKRGGVKDNILLDTINREFFNIINRFDLIKQLMRGL